MKGKELLVRSRAEVRKDQKRRIDKMILDMLAESSDKLKNMRTMTEEQRWIPVTEGLPECNESVVCYSTKWGGRCFVGYRGYISGDWIEDGILHLGDVTHWMPLPEPPKED